MKKLLLVIAMVAAGFTANAQEGVLNVGGTIGLPTGDMSDFFDVTGAIEANYLFTVADKIKVGPSVSYIHFQGEGADVAFLPIAVAGRYDVSEKFVVGADLGYGIGVRPSGATEDGFYYRPMVGYKATEKITIHVDYSSVAVDGTTASSFGLGGTYSFSL